MYPTGMPLVNVNDQSWVGKRVGAASREGGHFDERNISGGTRNSGGARHVELQDVAACAFHAVGPLSEF